MKLNVRYPDNVEEHLGSDILFRYRETLQEYAKIHTFWGLWRTTQASKTWEIRMHFLWPPTDGLEHAQRIRINLRRP